MVTTNLKKYTNEELISIIDNMHSGRMGYSLSDLKALQSEANNRTLPPEYPGIIADLLRRALQGDIPPVNLSFGDTAEVLNPQSVKDIKEVLDRMPEVPPVEEKPAEAPVTAQTIRVPDVKPAAEPKAEEPRPARPRRTATTEEYVPPVTARQAKIDFQEDLMEDYNEEKYPVLSFLCGFYKFIAWVLVIASFVAFGIFAAMYFKVNMMMVLGALCVAILLSVLSLLSFYALSEKQQLMLDIERHLRRK